MTCLYSHKLNKVVESENCHLLEFLRAFLFGAHMPISYWVDYLNGEQPALNQPVDHLSRENNQNQI